MDGGDDRFMIGLYMAAAYIAVISIAAVIVTVTDKIAAKRRRRRVSEQALLTLAAFGGSLAMFLTMLLIRHKTKHVVFMAGLPIIMLLQMLFAWFISRAVI